MHVPRPSSGRMRASHSCLVTVDDIAAAHIVYRPTLPGVSATAIVLRPPPCRAEAAWASVKPLSPHAGDSTGMSSVGTWARLARNRSCACLSWEVWSLAGVAAAEDAGEARSRR